MNYRNPQKLGPEEPLPWPRTAPVLVQTLRLVPQHAAGVQETSEVGGFGMGRFLPLKGCSQDRCSHPDKS